MRRNRRTQKTQSRGKGPSENAIVYRGPIVTAAEKKAQDLEVVTLYEDVQVVAAAGGTLTNVFTSDPTVGTPQGWTAWAARFREYRVLAIEAEFCPPYLHATPVVAGAESAAVFPLYEVEDRASGTPLGSYTAAAAYASLQMHPINSRWKRRMDMSSTDEAQFSSTGSSPAAPFYILWYAANLLAAANFGRARIAYVIQFKNRIA
jgi:hypothetical protein